ncbi:MAG: hypothetical protein QNL04_12770 [SAR324 cluster bacterium]|nr:hypothetical protein [SAR324 cluster bacterium]
MRIFLLLIMAAFIMVGCKGDDGADGTISVTLEASTDFTKSSVDFAIGCYIQSSSKTNCICQESGTEYTGTASGSSYCSNFASDVTLVASGTTYTNQAAGTHYTCSSSSTSDDFDNFCGSGDTNTTNATLAVNAGSSGSTGIPGKDGDVGALADYTILFGPSDVTISK